MKYVGLWSPELRHFFEKFVKPSGHSSYILNVRSLTSHCTPLDGSSKIIVLAVNRMKIKYLIRNHTITKCVWFDEKRIFDPITMFFKTI